MAITRIELTTTDQSGNVAIALDNLRNARDRLDYAKAVMEAALGAQAGTTPNPPIGEGGD